VTTLECLGNNLTQNRLKDGQWGKACRGDEVIRAVNPRANQLSAKRGGIWNQVLGGQQKEPAWAPYSGNDTTDPTAGCKGLHHDPGRGMRGGERRRIATNRGKGLFNGYRLMDYASGKEDRLSTDREKKRGQVTGMCKGSFPQSTNIEREGVAQGISGTWDGCCPKEKKEKGTQRGGTVEGRTTWRGIF